MKLWRNKSKEEKINDIIDALIFYRDQGELSYITLDAINDRLVVQLDFSIQDEIINE